MDSDQSNESENEAFQRAMELAGSEFLEVWCFRLFLVFNLICFLKDIFTNFS